MIKNIVKLLFIVTALITTANLSAQDLIKTMDGKILEVRLIDVTEERVLYKNWDDIEGEDQSIDSEEVDYVRYERAGSGDHTSYDESEYDYDPIKNHSLKYLPTEDKFYTGVLAGVAMPVGYYNYEFNSAGFYSEFFMAYDWRGYNRIKLDLGYMQIPTDQGIVRQAFLAANPQLSSADLLDVKYSGDRLFYISAGSTSEIFYEKLSININPRVGLVLPRDLVTEYTIAGNPNTMGEFRDETEFGWMNGLAVNARYRLAKNLVLNGNLLYFDGIYQISGENGSGNSIAGIRTLNAGVGLSYSIPYTN